MLAIARALVRDPKIILLDEPFEGLAPVIVRDLMRACGDLASAAWATSTSSTWRLALTPLCQTSCRLDRIGIWGHG